MRTMILLLAILALLGCGEDVQKKSPNPSDTMEDMGDMSTPDVDEPDMIDEPDQDTTDQDTANDPPELQNLPAEVATRLLESDSFDIQTQDPQGDPVTLSVITTTCSFNLSIQDSALIWTCPASPEVCTASIRAEDPGLLQDQNTLTIQCQGSIPEFSSTPPTSATEFQVYSYTVSCADNENATTLSIASTDTCGGTLAQNTYNWTPGEADGGTNCVVAIVCSNGTVTQTQSATIGVQEVNSPPVFNNLPANVRTLWGRSGTFQVTASDADLPVQNLVYSAGTSDCTFPVSVSGSGLVSYQCGQAVEECGQIVRVQDGVATTDITLDIECFNNAPSVQGVSIDPSQPQIAGQGLTCNYTFSDPDGDTNASAVSWLVNGTARATGATFSNYEPGDLVRCRVTPFDGLTQGTPVDSAQVQAPNDLEIAIGGSHVCIVTGLGGVRCWGTNTHGQVGATSLSSTSAVTALTPSGLGSGVTAISAGDIHTCAVQNGAAKCWGGGMDGLQGPGVTTNTSTPTTVLSSGVTAIASGEEAACAIQNGGVKCWGRNEFGISGPTNLKGINSTPVAISGMTSNVTAIGVGVYHACAIQSGALKCWGHNAWGQLATSVGLQTSNSYPTPRTVFESGVTELVTGNFHLCAKHNGTLKCWGSNLYQQLGRTTAENADPNPLPHPGITAPYSLLTSGYADHLCMEQNNQLKCWGSNLYDQILFDGGLEYANPIVAFNAEPRALGLGTATTCAQITGGLYCWGTNANGEFGNGVRASGFDRFGPVLVNF